MSCESINSSLFTFPCSQPPPAPLPDTPATAVTFAFDGDGAFTAAAAANVGEALNLIDDFLACLQPPCEASEGQVYLADSDGQMRLVDSSDLVSEALSDLLPGAGQFLYNAGGVVAAVDFCTQVQTCLNNLATSPGQVLMSTPSGIAGVDLCSEVQNCLGNLTGSDGQFLIQQGGALTALDHCQAVQSCLSSLLPANGSVLTGTGSGGVTATNLCQEVMNCLDANSTPGTFFLNNGGNVTATDFVTAVDNALAGSTNLCDEVEGCFGGALSPGEVYYNSGAGTMPTDLGTLLAPFLAGLALNCVEVQNCLGGALGPGQVYYNNGTGTAPTDLASLVDSSPITGGTPGQPVVIGPDGSSLTQYSPADGQILHGGAAGLSDSDLPTYMNTYHPAGVSGQACTPEMWLNDGAGWRVGKGVPEAPPAWTYPLAPPSLDLELQVNSATGCYQWVCPSHVVGSFTVGPGGDFPSVVDFVTWAQGKSVDLELTLLSDQPGNLAFQDVPGEIRINSSGFNFGNVTLVGNETSVILNDAANFDTLVVRRSADLYALSTVTVAGVTAQGNAALTVFDGGFVRVEGVLSVTNTQNTASAALVTGNGTLRCNSASQFTGGSIAALAADRNSELTLVGNIAAQSNAGHGISVNGSSMLYTEGNVTANNNGAAGIILATSSTFNQSNPFALLTLDASSNGSFGLNVEHTSSLVSDANDVTLNTNLIGALVRRGGNLSLTQLNGTINVQTNTLIGIAYNTCGNIRIDGGGVANISGSPEGLQSNLNGTLTVTGALLANFNVTGNTSGITHSNGAMSGITGANVTGNTSFNVNPPANVLSASGSFVAI